MSKLSATAPDSGGDALCRYVLATALPFQELRDAASQLAGLMVLGASGARSATVDHPMLAVAQEKWRSAADAVRSLTPPAAGVHFHRHLLAATSGLEQALGVLTASGILTRRLDPSLPMLQQAWREIVHAANALPGFSIVDFEQSCCAAHARSRRRLVAD